MHNDKWTSYCYHSVHCFYIFFWYNYIFVVDVCSVLLYCICVFRQVTWCPSWYYYPRGARFVLFVCFFFFLLSFLPLMKQELKAFMDWIIVTMVPLTSVHVGVPCDIRQGYICLGWNSVRFVYLCCGDVIMFVLEHTDSDSVLIDWLVCRYWLHRQ